MDSQFITDSRLPRVESETTATGALGHHYQMFHLHFDLNGSKGSVAKFLKSFAASNGYELIPHPFELPSSSTLRSVYNHSEFTLSSNDANILTDPQSYGAPQSHFSEKKFCGPISSIQFLEYLDKFRDGVERLSSNFEDFGGYVELERVYYRSQISKSAPDSLASNKRVAPLPFEFGKVELPNLKPQPREFRVTEIHISFEQISLCDPGVLSALLKAGFYSAFVKIADNPIDYKFIATIQGFDPEIMNVVTLVEPWLRFHSEEKLLNSTVTIKKEDIVSYFVFGNPELRKIQSVLKPGTLRWSQLGINE